MGLRAAVGEGAYAVSWADEMLTAHAVGARCLHADAILVRAAADEAWALLAAGYVQGVII